LSLFGEKVKKKKARRSAPRSSVSIENSSRKAYDKLANRGSKWDAKVAGKVLLVASLALIVTCFPTYFYWVLPSTSSSSGSSNSGTTVNPAFSRYLAGESWQSSQQSGESQQSGGQAFEAPSLNPISSQNSIGKVALMWTPVAGAGMYIIYRNSTPITSVAGWEQGYIAVAVGGNSITWVDASPLRGMNYYAVVAAVVGGARTTVSNWEGVNVILPPPAPVNLTAPANPEVPTFVLSWNVTDYASAYEVYQSSAPITSVDGMTPIATVSNVNITTLQVGPVAIGTYYYVVSALNNAGAGPISANVKVQIYPPAEPTWDNVSGTLYTATGDVNLQWTASSFATAYFVYCDGILIGSTPDTSFTDTSTKYNDTTYTYKVSAGNGIGNSTLTPPVGITVILNNLLGSAAAWSNSLNPITQPLVIKALDWLCGIVGVDPSSANSIVAFLIKEGIINGGDTTLKYTYTLNIADYNLSNQISYVPGGNPKVSPGIKVAVTCGLTVTLMANGKPVTGVTDSNDLNSDCYIEFVIQPKVVASFQMDQILGALSSVIKLLETYGVSVSFSASATGVVNFDVFLNGTVRANSIGIDLSASLSISVEWLKVILEVVCPAAAGVINTIASVLKAVGIDIFSWFTSTLTITVDISDTYTFATAIDALSMALTITLVALNINIGIKLPWWLGGFHIQLLSFQAGTSAQISFHWQTGSSSLAVHGYWDVFYSASCIGLGSSSGTWYIVKW